MARRLRSVVDRKDEQLAMGAMPNREGRRVTDVGLILFVVSLALMALAVIACTGDAPASTPTTANLGSTPRTYKVVFPFREPQSIDEQFVHDRNDVVTYMNWVRTKDNISLAMALTNAFVSG
ncbi:MAG: hypothetical protein QGI09_06755, partial [Dehalococcoidia bacterium]|nr:hypothetical protein [Dehalococcoidia bacterium]